MRYIGFPFVFATCIVTAAMAPAGVQCTAADLTMPSTALDSAGDATELRFNEFFALPVGPRGLAFAEKLRALDGKRVHISGYVVSEESPVPGRILIAAMPVTMAEAQDGPADDLPPATLFVHGYPAQAQRSKFIRVTGRLSVGRYEEADRRVSWVRLDVTPVHSSAIH